MTSAVLFSFTKIFVLKFNNQNNTHNTRILEIHKIFNNIYYSLTIQENWQILCVIYYFAISREVLPLCFNSWSLTIVEVCTRFVYIVQRSTKFSYISFFLWVRSVIRRRSWYSWSTPLRPLALKTSSTRSSLSRNS